MAQTDDILGAIDKAIAAPSRTSLSRWMRQNYAELVKRLEGHQNDWTTLAEVFAAYNLKDRSGNPPSPQTVRKTWKRVRKDAQKTTLATGPAAATAVSPPPTQPIEPADEPPARHTFRPAKIR